MRFGIGFLALGALLLAARPGLAVDYYLVAKPFDKAFGGGGAGATVPFPPTDDAMVRSSQPGANFGSGVELKVEEDSVVHHGYLQFDVQGLGGPVVSAILRLYVTNGSVNGVGVWSVANAWDESTLSYASAPAISGSSLDSLASVSKNQWIELDVTSAVTGNGIVSFGLKNFGGDSARFSSKEGAKPPELVIEAAGSTGVPMWGFALDADMNLATDDGEMPTVPGPTLDAGTASTLRVFLRNDLLEPVSIVIPGQAMPDASGCGAPVWTDGSTGPRTSATQRVRSFGCEAAPGGTQLYEWSATAGNPFRPGSFVYHTGTHPQIGVQMGLYGEARGLSGAGEAYPGIGFDAEISLLFSEIDPALHQAVGDGSYGTAPAPTSALEYHPSYFLVNGEPYSASSSCFEPGVLPGDQVLIRLLNAGLRELDPMLLDARFELVAEGGHPLPYAQDRYVVHVQPTSAKDLIWSPAHSGTYKLIERRLSLTTGMQSGGGMQACIHVASPGPVTPTLLADALVKSSAPGQNFGSDPELKVEKDTTIFQSYLKFDIAGLSGPIQSATLRLYVINGSVHGVAVHSVADISWSEGGISYASAPGIGGAALDSLSQISAGQWIELDVTSAITGNGAVSFGLKNSGTDSARFSSKEGAHPPELVIVQ